MSRERLLTVALVAFCSVVTARGADGWARLKTGMTQQQTVAAIGAPVLTSRGRGLDIWLYDGGAEVVTVRGTVVAWTAPAGCATTGGQQIDLSKVPPLVATPVPTSQVAHAGAAGGGKGGGFFGT